MTARAVLAVVLLACASRSPFRAPEIAEWGRKRAALVTLLRDPRER